VGGFLCGDVKKELAKAGARGAGSESALPAGPVSIFLSPSAEAATSIYDVQHHELRERIFLPT
jgi:hypothetical protein